MINDYIKFVWLPVSYGTLIFKIFHHKNIDTYDQEVPQIIIKLCMNK